MVHWKLAIRLIPQNMRVLNYSVSSGWNQMTDDSHCLEKQHKQLIPHLSALLVSLTPFLPFSSHFRCQTLPSVILTCTYQNRHLDNGRSYCWTSKFSHPRWPLTWSFHLYKWEVGQISMALPGHLLPLSYASSRGDKSPRSSKGTQTGHTHLLLCVFHVNSLSLVVFTPPSKCFSSTHVWWDSLNHFLLTYFQ